MSICKQSFLSEHTCISYLSLVQENVLTYKLSINMKNLENMILSLVLTNQGILHANNYIKETVFIAITIVLKIHIGNVSPCCQRTN